MCDQQTTTMMKGSDFWLEKKKETSPDDVMREKRLMLLRTEKEDAVSPDLMLVSMVDVCLTQSDDRDE